MRCRRQRVLFQGALRIVSALVHCWKCQIRVDQHFLSLPSAKSVSTVSWEALSLSTYRDHLSFSGNPTQDRWVWCSHGAQSCPFLAKVAMQAAGLCLFGMSLAQIIYVRPALSRHSYPEHPRGRFPFYRSVTERKHSSKVQGRCRRTMANNLRLAKPFECLNIPVRTGRTRQKLFPELTLLGS